MKDSVRRKISGQGVFVQHRSQNIPVQKENAEEKDAQHQAVLDGGGDGVGQLSGIGIGQGAGHRRQQQDRHGIGDGRGKQDQGHGHSCKDTVEDQGGGRGVAVRLQSGGQQGSFPGG